MKNFLLICFFVAAGELAAAQTNTFPSTGNVGLGTTSPQSPFHMHASRTSSQFRMTNPEAGGMLSALSYSDDNTSLGFDAYYDGSAWMMRSNTAALFYKANGHVFIYGLTGTSGTHASPYAMFAMNITSGNLGIGTTTPAEKLSVNGKIRAHEVKVETTGWPDYVFRKDYRLRPLAEVEKFIRANEHLPEIPSAAAIEKNGLDLGQMNASLLKKIEELTLYLIEQDKKFNNRIEELQRQISVLQNNRPRKLSGKVDW